MLIEKIARKIVTPGLTAIHQAGIRRLHPGPVSAPGLVGDGWMPMWLDKSEGQIGELENGFSGPQRVPQYHRTRQFAAAFDFSTFFARIDRCLPTRCADARRGGAHCGKTAPICDCRLNTRENSAGPAEFGRTTLSLAE